MTHAFVFVPDSQLIRDKARLKCLAFFKSVSRSGEKRTLMNHLVVSLINVNLQYSFQV